MLRRLFLFGVLAGLGFTFYGLGFGGYLSWLRFIGLPGSIVTDMMLFAVPAAVAVLMITWRVHG